MTTIQNLPTDPRKLQGLKTSLPGTFRILVDIHELGERVVLALWEQRPERAR